MTDFSEMMRELTFEEFRKEVLEDYRIACLSRQCSVIGRKNYSHKYMVTQILDNKSCLCRNDKFDKVSVLTGNLKKVLNPARKLLRYICSDCPKRDELQVPITDWLNKNYESSWDKYNDNLYNETSSSVPNIEEVKPVYTDEPQMMTGREILRDNFDYLLYGLQTLSDDLATLRYRTKGHRLEGMWHSGSPFLSYCTV